MTWALIGNPNSGKTTLYNRLTKSSRPVGNLPGVTVDIAEGKTENGTVLADLPGVYALSPYTEEERVTRDFLKKKPDAVLNIVDATRLERNLWLTYQLLETGLPVVVAVNMMDEAKAQGIRLDLDVLSERLGVPAVGISAKNGDGIDRLQKTLPRAVSARGRSARERWREVEKTVSLCAEKGNDRLTEKLDAVLCHHVWGLPIFVLVLCLMFSLVFGSVGKSLSEGIRTLTEEITAPFVRTLLLSWKTAPGLVRFVDEALIRGVGGVLAFLPQTALLFFFLTWLQDCGYLARAAFLADRLLRGLGLSGRSGIPLLMGFGCTTPAVMAARTATCDAERQMTVLLTPFMSCSAKLTVYVWFSAAFFPQHPTAVVLFLYLLGVLVGMLSGMIFHKTLFRGTYVPFVLELPPYRLPRAADLFRQVREKCRGFLIKAGSVIFLMNTVLWLLENFNLALQPCAVRESILYRIADWLTPLFRPLGFGFPEAVIALLAGAAAKESVLSALLLLPGAAAKFSAPSALSFLVFVLLYTPCASALGTMKKELNDRRLFWFSVCWQLTAAFLFSWLTFVIAGG